MVSFPEVLVLKMVVRCPKCRITGTYESNEVEYVCGCGERYVIRLKMLWFKGNDIFVKKGSV